MRATNRVAVRRRRKKILKEARGFWGRKKNVYTVAKNQVERSWQFRYVGRKLKKRDYRRLWNQRINAGARQHGMNYSQLIHGLSQANIHLNRKVLADLALNHPEAFEALVNKAKAAFQQAA
jgi:large subunit ribosomal protein L20